MIGTIKKQVNRKTNVVTYSLVTGIVESELSGKSPLLMPFKTLEEAQLEKRKLNL